VQDTESGSQEKNVNQTTPPNNTVDKSQPVGVTSPKSQFQDSGKQTDLCERSETTRKLLRNAPFLPTSSAGDKEPRYHGPTSSLFDEEPPDRGILRRRTTDPVASESFARSRLMAVAAKQRAFEVSSVLIIPIARDKFVSRVAKRLPEGV
jgi:hypothetical protein